MSKDYYKILGVSPTSSAEEIKKAYRQLSLKWHPDRNPNVDVTLQMQDINEAYAILKDTEKKVRYDEEYYRFVSSHYNVKSNDSNNYKEKKGEQSEENDTDTWTYDYEVHDEKVKEDIHNARNYAKDLVEEFMRSFKEASKAAAKGAANNAFNYAVGWILSGVILSILGLLFRTCN